MFHRYIPSGKTTDFFLSKALSIYENHKKILKIQTFFYYLPGSMSSQCVSATFAQLNPMSVYQRIFTGPCQAQIFYGIGDINRSCDSRGNSKWLLKLGSKVFSRSPCFNHIVTMKKKELTIKAVPRILCFQKYSTKMFNDVLRSFHLSNIFSIRKIK